MDYTFNEVLFAFSLTLFAGLATGVGSALAFLTKKTNTIFLTASLGFSAGVMIYVSFIEIFFKARTALSEVYGLTKGTWLTVIAFFGGIFLIGIIDKLVPNIENPHEVRNVEEMEDQKTTLKNKKLLRMGLFTAVAIAIHNFPEGLATFAAALTDPSIGISIAIAIAIAAPGGAVVVVPAGDYQHSDKPEHHNQKPAQIFHLHFSPLEKSAATKVTLRSSQSP